MREICRHENSLSQVFRLGFGYWNSLDLHFRLQQERRDLAGRKGGQGQSSGRADSDIGSPGAEAR
jgi:hypothetical protein